MLHDPARRDARAGARRFPHRLHHGERPHGVLDRYQRGFATSDDGQEMPELFDQRIETWLQLHVEAFAELGGVIETVVPDNLKAELKAPSEPGPRPYVIVIPIRKDAEWWSLSQEQRAAMMQEHTEASLPYHKTVKRKLYHSTGLGDLDFITYFETSRLEDFHSLILALEKVKEFRHNRRFGHPTLLGTVRSLEEIIEVLAQ